MGEFFCTRSLTLLVMMVAAIGIYDHIIKTLGRWESVAYLQHIKIPHNQLAGNLNIPVSIIGVLTLEHYCAIDIGYVKLMAFVSCSCWWGQGLCPFGPGRVRLH